MNFASQALGQPCKVVNHDHQNRQVENEKGLANGQNMATVTDPC